MFLNKQLIISLTSYPTRINTVHEVVQSLLVQSICIDKIVLWLSENQFKNKEKDLPASLLKLLNNKFEINWFSQEINIRPYNKLVHSLKKYPEAYIITVDDDVIYDKNSIDVLLNTYKKYPECIIANRTHYITFNEDYSIAPYKDWSKVSDYNEPSYNLLLTGVGAVLYYPNSLYKDVLDNELFLNLCKNTDDIWFWAMAVLNNTKIKNAINAKCLLKYVKQTQLNCLWININSDGNNDENMRKILNYYPQILEKLDKVVTQKFYKNIFEKIFSIKRARFNGKNYLIITILGIKLKLRKGVKW